MSLPMDVAYSGLLLDRTDSDFSFFFRATMESGSKRIVLIRGFLWMLHIQDCCWIALIQISAFVHGHDGLCPELPSDCHVIAMGLNLGGIATLLQWD